MLFCMCLMVAYKEFLICPTIFLSKKVGQIYFLKYTTNKIQTVDGKC